MKNKFLPMLLSSLLAFAALQSAEAVPATPSVLNPSQQHVQTAQLAAQFFSRYHYNPIALDDAMSEKIFNRFLKSLDPDKFFFVQADIDQLAPFRTKIDDAILSDDLSIPFSIFNLYEKRAVERLGYARELLKQGFEFDAKESYHYDREKETWAKTDDELRDLWRKRVKNDWLRLKLAGKDDKAIREMLEKRYDHSRARINKYNSDDVFQIFMSAYANSIEPHTDYLGIRESEDFDIAMKLSLSGIGAVLQEREEYVTIRELVPGGPAALSNSLAVGDRIVGVGQGENSTVTDILGWRLDDAVGLIRGAKGSTVVLDVLPVGAGQDGKHKLVSIVRDKINLEQQAAKKSIVPIKSGSATHRVGVISLPTFYQDFEARRKGDKDFKSATRDVRRLLDELKKEKVDSVLIDLRFNGGGSLDEAVDLTGLFIDKGPVVQQRDSQGKLKVESDTRPGVAWSGPLGVLINRGSASASEIFAAAIQDYGRGLVIGEGSFGKGTVQTLINLDQIAHNDKPKLGELKLTIAQFFRINGGTTQLRGVVPDIDFPSVLDAENYGESSFDNALPWTQVKAAEFVPAGNLTSIVPLLKLRHEERIAKDKDFQYLKEDIAKFTQERKASLISLNEAQRRKEKAEQEAQAKLREKTRDLMVVRNGKNGKRAIAAPKSKQDDGLQNDERDLATELIAEKEKKNLKDVLLDEAVHILSDEVDLLKGRAGTRLAGGAATGAALK